MVTTPSPRKRHALQLFEELPAHYDELGAALSFFQDPRWRRAMVDVVEAAPRSGYSTSPQAPGWSPGRWSIATAARLLGWTRAPPMLGAGPCQARCLAPALAERIELVEGEAEALPFADAEFDHLTFTYLLRYVDDPAATLRELARVVQAGRATRLLGVLRAARNLAAAWRLYTRVGLPALGRLASRGWFEVGRFLGPQHRRLLPRAIRWSAS